MRDELILLKNLGAIRTLKASIDPAHWFSFSECPFSLSLLQIIEHIKTRKKEKKKRAPRNRKLFIMCTLNRPYSCQALA